MIPMSAIGPKRTWASALQMSAFGGKADIFGGKAAIDQSPTLLRRAGATKSKKAAAYKNAANMMEPDPPKPSPPLAGVPLPRQSSRVGAASLIRLSTALAYGPTLKSGGAG